MVQSVEMMLDEAADRRIREQWSQLIAAGLPSQGRHTGSSNRPHVTLGVAPALTQEQEAELRAAATVGLLPLPIRLGGVLLFGSDPYVVARAVVPTVPLLQFQEQIAQSLLTSAGSPPHQAAGAWTAHVTLGRRFSGDQLPAALDALGPMSDILAAAVALRRWDSDRRVDWVIS